MIKLIKIKDNEETYKKLYDWCQQDFVYEYFEQRKLSYEEIENKYKNKLKEKKQDIFFINYDNKDIGYTQIYKYEDNKDIYEFDLFIGEEEYLNKGLGKHIIDYIVNYIYGNTSAKSIIGRPFKRNIRSVKCLLKCKFKIIDEYIGKDTLGNDEIIVALKNDKN